ncbi:receptor-like protein kinase FERONIA [Abrus precatorius]|uniref:Receptor-like protein kinase FERONIA n=1 Tax=Abrus precatorius TaxID=3816 RepID=A0A8B8L5G0_ABRPR|nr:receptor-like protein kinase FERONIA [Abrus precatorius]
MQFSIIESQTEKPSILAHTLKSLSHFSSGSPNTTTPFSSARISTSKFTYSFSVTHGPWFLRLHFNPTSYDIFEHYKPLFSVKVGNFTLLKDFNPSLWVVNDDDTIIREFCISNETAGTILNVNFLPTTNHSDAYAFVNGIEVVSMPPFLYYSDPTEIYTPNFKLVGSDNQYQLYSDKALETRYRVKVGDMQVQRNQDTGMFRYWDSDRPYILKEYPQSVQSDYTHQPNYKNEVAPNYTAPAIVYMTARSYGMDATEDYNVTWEFEVDPEFVYMVRLHFCEFDYHVHYKGDRVFQIFIDDNLVEELADVINWSGGNLIPVYRDYAVIMLGSKNSNLSIKLQRLPKGVITRYRDVLLNGIEILKISDDNDNLAEPNPDPRLSPHQQQILQTQTSKHKSPIIVIITVAAVSGLVLSSIIGVIVFQRRRRRRAHDTKENPRKTKTEGSSLPSHLCRYFTIAEIRAATNNLDDASIVGVGGFGNVYKGHIDRDTPVAIKRLKPGSDQGDPEFKNEIVMLSQLRHPHLVPLFGYCNDGAEMIVVYDFMHRGSFRDYLYGSDNPPLSWKQRLQILLGASRGLHYLHAGAKQSIIHRDVKSTNILLDENWEAKVSDLGLSKVGPNGVSRTHVTTTVKGSVGYLDPQYYKSQRLTLKSDVYSFGVVLLEVLCARPPLDHSLDNEKVCLVDWVQRCYDEAEIHLTVDPFLKDSITAECLKCYSDMALSCLLDDPKQRPSMTDVIEALELAIHLAEDQHHQNISISF